MTEPEPAAVPSEVDAEPPEDEPGPDRQGRRDERVRDRLRAAEAERDALRVQRDLLAESVANSVVSQSVAVPADYWTLAGRSPVEYLSDDGLLDVDRLGADVAVFLTERPAAGVLVERHHADQGPKRTAPGRGATWDRLLAPPRR